MTPALHQSTLTSVPLINRGKVRDLYQLDDQHLLIVTTDRISAFDVILPTPIPGKGRILANMAQFWFRHTQEIIRNHLASDLSLSDYLTPDELAQLDGRGVVVGRYTPLPIEAIVRGYLVGSGWKEYQQSQSVCGLALPAGLQLAQQLPEALFTPSSKADVGDHDENITYEQMVAKIGPELAAQVRDISLKLYQSAAEFALARGIIIADTKFEFGLDEQGELVLIDEILTPDSSRFWPAKDYVMGSNPPSFDKQFVRDYLETLDWDKTAPGPELPEMVVKATLTKYQEAQARLTENQAMRGLFITGTDTEVGKTWVSAALIKGFAQQGYQVIPRKPVASGCIWVNGQLLSEDAQQLQQAVIAAGQTPPPLAQICPYLFEPAISPARAIAQTQNPQLQHIGLAQLHQACLANHPNEQPPQANLLLVEGAGGFYSPLAPDGLNADLAQKLGFPIVLVVANRLGCLNHALLSLSAIAERKLPMQAIVLNDITPDADINNLRDLAALVSQYSPFPNTPIYHQAWQADAQAIKPLMISYSLIPRNENN